MEDVDDNPFRPPQSEGNAGLGWQDWLLALTGVVAVPFGIAGVFLLVWAPEDGPIGPLMKVSYGGGWLAAAGGRWLGTARRLALAGSLVGALSLLLLQFTAPEGQPSLGLVRQLVNATFAVAPFLVAASEARSNVGGPDDWGSRV